MNSKLDQFTWGFELEGVFSTRLLSLLPEGGDFKSDGSVRDESIRDRIDIIYRREGNSEPHHEYASPIFNTYGEMIAALSIFYSDPTLYASNISCGLHIHVKGKPGVGRLYQAQIFGMETLGLMQDFAMTKMGTTQKNRFSESVYCHRYSEVENYQIRDLKHRIDHNEKYRFVRNHPSGTAEFRFFSPVLKSTVEKVNLFFEFFAETICNDAPIIVYSDEASSEDIRLQEVLVGDVSKHTKTYVDDFQIRNGSKQINLVFTSVHLVSNQLLFESADNNYNEQRRPNDWYAPRGLDRYQSVAYPEAVGSYDFTTTTLRDISARDLFGTAHPSTVEELNVFENLIVPDQNAF